MFLLYDFTSHSHYVICLHIITTKIRNYSQLSRYDTAPHGQFTCYYNFLPLGVLAYTWSHSMHRNMYAQCIHKTMWTHSVVDKWGLWTLWAFTEETFFSKCANNSCQMPVFTIHRLWQHMAHYPCCYFNQRCHQLQLWK